MRGDMDDQKPFWAERAALNREIEHKALHTIYEYLYPDAGGIADIHICLQVCFRDTEIRSIGSSDKLHPGHDPAVSAGTAGKVHCGNHPEEAVRIYFGTLQRVGGVRIYHVCIW